MLYYYSTKDLPNLDNVHGPFLFLSLSGVEKPFGKLIMDQITTIGHEGLFEYEIDIEQMAHGVQFSIMNTKKMYDYKGKDPEDFVTSMMRLISNIDASGIGQMRLAAEKWGTHSQKQLEAVRQHFFNEDVAMMEATRFPFVVIYPRHGKIHMTKKTPVQYK